VTDFKELLVDLDCFHISSVFDVPQEAIRFGGTCSDGQIEVEKKKLESLINKVRRGNPPKDKAKGLVPKRICEGMDQQMSAPGHITILAIDPVEDEIALKTWTDHLLPKLPKAIENLPVGEKYSASLVLQKSNDGPARPIIRFRSSRGQSEATRKIIRAKISEICREKSLPVIPVQFSQGMTVRLARGHYNRASSALGEQDDLQDDPPNDQQTFHHQRRYWKQPGMGASIGMSACSDHSATLGGYILIDGTRYILSVDHFIQNADSCECSSSALTKLSSPSLSDIEEMKGALDAKIDEIQLKITDFAEHGQQTQHDRLVIPLNHLDSMLFLGDPKVELDCFSFFRREMAKQSGDFELGEVVRRCVDGAIRPSTRLPQSVKHCMDWSICSVVSERKGQNLYRFGLVAAPGLAELKEEKLGSQGTGPLVEKIAEVHAGDRVHYVGQTSGFREGYVNAALVLVVDREDGKERVSQEWGILVPGAEQGSPGDFAGDSGAWVIREDNEVIGLLWGWSGGQLLFTPIQDVFADIQRDMCATEISLPPPPRKRSETQNAVRISRPTPQKIPREKIMASLSPLNSHPERLSLRLANSNGDMAVKTELDQPRNLDRSYANSHFGFRTPSPVPSLTSSVSSSADDSSPCSPMQWPESAEHPIVRAHDTTTDQSLGETEEIVREDQTPAKTLRKSPSFEHPKKFWLRSRIFQSATFPLTKEDDWSAKVLLSV
jgi:hypothetical protein